MKILFLIMSVLISDQYLNAQDQISKWEEIRYRIEYTENELNTLVKSSSKVELFYFVKIGEATTRDPHITRISAFISMLYVQTRDSLSDDEIQRVNRVMIHIANSVSGLGRASVIGQMIKMESEALLEYAEDRLKNDESPWVKFTAKSLVDGFPRSDTK